MYSRHFTRSGRESGRLPGFRGSHHAVARKKAAPARRFFSRPASVAWGPVGPARRTCVSRGWRRRGVGRPGWSPRRSLAGAAAPCCARWSWDLRCSHGPATVPAPAVRLMAGAQGARARNLPGREPRSRVWRDRLRCRGDPGWPGAAARTVESGHCVWAGRGERRQAEAGAAGVHLNLASPGDLDVRAVERG
jgi:hypothetical protein